MHMLIMLYVHARSDADSCAGVHVADVICSGDVSFDWSVNNKYNTLYMYRRNIDKGVV